MDHELEFVNVAIRIKPLLDKETTSKCLQIISQDPPVLLLHERSLTFNFDYLYTEEASQKTIYEQMVKPLVKHVKQGYNCTVFANGQTGTGKTYTIGTDPYVKNKEDFGLIPRALNDFFEFEDDGDHSEVEISLSFIEIYNEKVFDLLLSDKPEEKPLQVKGLMAQGFCKEKVFNIVEAKHFLKMGNKNRHTAETKQNAKSSRSHAIFTIYCNVKHKDQNTSAKLNLVDLAGSESIKKTGNQGSTFQEGVNINRGLLSIGQVMTALSTNASHIPYRQSIITSILKDSLNSRNFVSLIACVSSSAEDLTETSQTLEFAQRVKKMKNKPEVNEVISQYKKENPSLFLQPRTSGTPFKRPAPVPTPRVPKKPRLFPLTTIDEPSADHNMLLPTPCSTHSSLSSSGISSMSSHIVNSLSHDLTQPNLSPVIKKYLSAMESSMMGKLELIIKSTLKRPSRVNNVQKHQENIENTPCVPWNKIQNEVSKLVRTELAQLTAKGTRATSSPIEEQLNNIRKVLSYGSPFTDEIDSLLTENIDDSHEQSKSLQNEDIEFKVPDLPLTNRKKSKSKRTPSISPIEYHNIVQPRRSIRLSMKIPSKKPEDFYWSSLSSSKIKGISLLESTLTNDSSSEQFQSSWKQSERLTDRTNLPNSAVNDKKRKTNLKKITMKTKPRKLTVADTPAGKRLMQKTRPDSPCTAQTKKVLTTLNTGNVKQLEQLNTIGSKTAQQIILFRNINGSLKRISDLSGLPGWGTKKFNKFVEHNFLKTELI